MSTGPAKSTAASRRQAAPAQQDSGSRSTVRRPLARAATLHAISRPAVKAKSTNSSARKQPEATLNPKAATFTGKSGSAPFAKLGTAQAAKSAKPSPSAAASAPAVHVDSAPSSKPKSVSVIKPVAPRYLDGASLGAPAPHAADTPDALDWERSMEAKLAQWRFMNVAALSELQREERDACAALVTLASELEAGVDCVAALTQELDAVRACAAASRLRASAVPPLAELHTALGEMRAEHRAACEGLLRALEALPMVVGPGGDAPVAEERRAAGAATAAVLAREIARFRMAAVEFCAAARRKGADEKCAAALEDIAHCMTQDAPDARAVLCENVRSAVDAMNMNMAHLAADMTRRRNAGRESSMAAWKTEPVQAGGGGKPKAKGVSGSRLTSGSALSAGLASGSTYVRKLGNSLGLGHAY